MREVQLRSSSIFDAAGEVDALNQQVRLALAAWRAQASTRSLHPCCFGAVFGAAGDADALK